MIEYNIKDALGNGGCPICKAAEENMEKLLWWFKTESHNDPSTLESLKNHPFICEKHKKEIIKMGSYISTTLEFLTKTDSELFSSLLLKNGKKFKKEIKTLSNPVCKFCEDEKRIEKHAVQTFVKMLDDDAIRDLYIKSDGLCRKHLIDVLEVIGEHCDKSVFLIRDALKRLSSVQNEFAAFFHKLDYRFSNEKKGKEQMAWLAALNFYSNTKKD